MSEISSTDIHRWALFNSIYYRKYDQIYNHYLCSIKTGTFNENYIENIDNLIKDDNELVKAVINLIKRDKYLCYFRGIILEDYGEIIHYFENNNHKGSIRYIEICIDKFYNYYKNFDYNYHKDIAISYRKYQIIGFGFNDMQKFCYGQ